MLDETDVPRWLVPKDPGLVRLDCVVELPTMPRLESDAEDDGWTSSGKAKDHNKICCWFEVERTEAYFLRPDATVVWRTVLLTSRNGSRRAWMRRDDQEL